MAKHSIKNRHGLDLLIGEVLSTNSKIDFVDKKEHRHDPDPNQVKARRELNQVKENDINCTASMYPGLSSITGLVQHTRRVANTPFSSPDSLSSIALPIEKLLRSSDCCYCDGTFKTAISLFSRLDMVHYKINITVIPTVYALLPAKSKSIYTPFFTAIRNLKPCL
ncbi:hypothetical protein RF11_08454 [Thelohanellus kitauei]|uniref:Uncharacterized protein n=1 Tax=Thelohanellus kitauei TaxID=669202 RepID=A0A0C2J9K2_THEKT|nr:hypothetical protein RF11_08454 [Thelohanellus kitauei]